MRTFKIIACIILKFFSCDIFCTNQFDTFGPSTFLPGTVHYHTNVRPLWFTFVKNVFVEKIPFKVHLSVIRIFKLP